MTKTKIIEELHKYNEKALYHLTFEMLVIESTEKEPPFKDSFIKLFAISPENDMIHVSELDGDNIRSFDMCKTKFITKDILEMILIQLNHKMYTLDTDTYESIFIGKSREKLLSN